MPIPLQISPLRRQVIIVARGHVTEDEIRQTTQDLIKANVPGFAKIIDVADATPELTGSRLSTSAPCFAVRQIPRYAARPLSSSIRNGAGLQTHVPMRRTKRGRSSSSVVCVTREHGWSRRRRSGALPHRGAAAGSPDIGDALAYKKYQRRAIF